MCMHEHVYVYYKGINQSSELYQRVCLIQVTLTVPKTEKEKYLILVQITHISLWHSS